MDGWLKVLVAAACLVVISAGGWLVYSEYEKRRGPTAEEILSGHERDTQRLNSQFGTNLKPYKEETE